MHTVIMLNQKAKLLYQDFAFLFRPFGKEISIQEIHEDGDSFDDIFPNLNDKLYGKGPWRAFAFVTDGIEAVNSNPKQNPFDFACGQQAPTSEKSAESLIRLTHHLAGFPARNVYEFEEYFYYLNKNGERCENDEDTVEFRKKASEQGTQLRQGFREKKVDCTSQMQELINYYDCLLTRPTELYLIKLRKPIRGNSYLTPLDMAVRTNLLEENFVDQNNYPNLCRFLVFDLHRLTAHNRNAQLFRFWLSFLTLATNNFNSSLFQPNSLYSFKCELDTEPLAELLTHKLSMNRAVANNIKERLTHKNLFDEAYGEEMIQEEKISIGYGRLEEKNAIIDLHLYGWANNHEKPDALTLNNQSQNTIQIIKRQLIEPRKQIANSSRKIKHKYSTFLGTYIPLNSFQAEDMEEQANALQDKVFSELSTNYLFEDEYAHDLNLAQDQISQKLKTRLYSETIQGTIGIIFGIIALTIFIMALNATLPAYVLLDGLFILLLTSFASIGIVLLHRKITRHWINTFNEDVLTTYQKIKHDMEKIEDRIKHVFNFMRYHHIITNAQPQRENSQLEEFQLRQYLGYVSKFNNLIETLGKELALPLKSRPIYDLGYYFDSEIPIEESPIFQLKPNKITEIPVMGNRLSLTVPYDGIRELDIQKIIDLKQEG